MAIAARRRELGHRNPHIAFAPDLQSPKARRRDADDGVGPACDFEELAHDRRRAAELFRQGKADDGGGDVPGAGSRIPEWAVMLSSVKKESETAAMRAAADAAPMVAFSTARSSIAATAANALVSDASER